MGRHVAVACLVGLLVSGAGSARADFCEDLQAILDGAKDGFAAVRGERISRRRDVGLRLLGRGRKRQKRGRGENQQLCDRARHRCFPFSAVGS